MANFIGFARTNYFSVKDESVFLEHMNRYDVEVIRDNTGRFGVISNCESGFPSHDAETYEDFDFEDILIPHLADGSVAILQMVGYEKMRYLVGYTIAVNSKGESEYISMNEIYQKAKRLGDEITHAEY